MNKSAFLADSRPVYPPRPTWIALVGHFFGFGFLGQVLYSVLQWNIASHTVGRQQANQATALMILLLLIPVTFSVVGALISLKWPLRLLGHPLCIALGVLATGGLGLFNLFIWFVVAMTGYC